MLRVLGVSRSGYNSWLHRLPSNQQIRKESVKKRINEIYNKSHQIYGAPKITEKIHNAGIKISERTVGKYMREIGIKAEYIKPYTVTTKDSDFSNKLENILNEQFNPSQPNAAWCTDITYLWTNTGFIYLTSIMDLYSRKIIAWNLTETLDVSCVVETINKAKNSRQMINPVIIHSDRGSQYVSSEYRKATANMQTSYSKKAFPWDNACIESFHALIKREWINRFKIKNYVHAYDLVFEYIEAFYNTVRIHSHCNYMSPDEFEKAYRKNKKSTMLLTG
ncbi:transposase for insertion sequence element IS904 [Clostridium pasteurianum DSM 525 = ATCC 6013]|uniref:Integrase catalytic region n=2 Tax=Clostridium pasteurianum TaxID=1501 RepID=A0A0H3J2B7_CLOPA|nr:transposase for insertion sequence element IS904 [Clostridium pasteurianum DSM 525 = ATCC 6013]AJA52054.1 transposase for insertion sequence element IS904 [Clostridium pasteurianum DSM 525 = ATCC 6013]ELP60780.1 integrase catalytic subunit [Clostridium pasteurianum DSM 525 = ATCC 6013]KRU11936.1 Integrase catalytic region [Clostridium pasteurianum DSM 525 = ATCC 6013]